MPASKTRDTWTSLERLLTDHHVERWNPNDINELESQICSFLDGLRASKRRKRGRQEEIPEEAAGLPGCGSDPIEQLDKYLSSIRAFLRRKLPFGSMKEPTIPPGGDKAKPPLPECPSAQGSVQRVYSVDAFLYLEEDIDELVAEGKIAREYCQRCGSVEMALTDFITHSFNQDQLVYLICFLLPFIISHSQETHQELMEKCAVVDVGSRLGIVLWASYFAAKCGLLPSEVHEVVGVEMDKKLFALQTEIGKKFCSRQIPLRPTSSKGEATQYLGCRVVESNCFEGNGKKELEMGQVIILHNVFEYFSSSPTEHMKCWDQVRQTVRRSGQMLICFPSLEETLGQLERDGAFSSTSFKERSAEEWIAAYVDLIDTTQVADDFFHMRNDGDEEAEEGEEAEEREEPLHRHDCCSHDHEGTECTDEGHGEEIPEMLELVRNLFVYRVR